MRRRPQKLQVSTFPFLAVLLCTMGSLILLMLVIDRRARFVAHAKVMQAALKARSDGAEFLAARAAELERRRQALHAVLLNQDLELSGQLKTVARQAGSTTESLNSEIDRLHTLQTRIDAAATLLSRRRLALDSKKQEATKKNDQTDATRRQLAVLASELESLERTLIDLKALRQREQQMYSVIPYRGKRGDNRQPIYLECAADSLILHPDHMVLHGGSQLRAEVDHRIQLLRSAGKATENPYLMMLVRPDGITTYYQATNALEGLKVDFGYEFIENDWVLDFPSNNDSFRAQPWMTAVDGGSKPPSTQRAVTPPLGAPKAVAHGVKGVAFGGNSSTPGSGTGTEQANGADGLSQPGAKAGLVSGGSSGTGTKGFASGGSGPGFPGGSEGEGTIGNGGSPNARGSAPRGFNQAGMASGNSNGAGGSGLAGPFGGSGTGQAGSLDGVGSDGSPTRSGAPSSGKRAGGLQASISGLRASPSTGSGTAGTGGPGGGGTAGSGGTGGSGTVGSGGSGGSGTVGSGGTGGSGTVGSGGTGGSGASGVAGTAGSPTAPSPSGNATQAGSGSTPSGLGGNSQGSGETNGNRNGSGNSGSRGAAVKGSPTGLAASQTGATGQGTSTAGSQGSGATGETTSGLNPSKPGASGGSAAPGTQGSEGTGPSGKQGTRDTQATASRTQGEVRDPKNLSTAAASGSAGTAGTNPSKGSPSSAAPGQGGKPSTGGGSSGSSNTNTPSGPSPGQGAGSASGGDSASQGGSSGSSNGSSAGSATGQGSGSATGGGGTGTRGGSGGEADPLARLAPSTLPNSVKKPSRTPIVRPGWMNGNRDWIIGIVCTPKDVVLDVNDRHFKLDSLSGPDNSLQTTIRQLIDRRQSSVPEGVPPYRPSIKFVVQPGGLRTYYQAYPAVEMLKLPMTRMTKEVEDDGTAGRTIR